MVVVSALVLLLFCWGCAAPEFSLEDFFKHRGHHLLRHS